MRKKFIKKTYENKIYIFFTYQLHMEMEVKKIFGLVIKKMNLI